MHSSASVNFNRKSRIDEEWMRKKDEGYNGFIRGSISGLM